MVNDHKTWHLVQFVHLLVFGSRYCELEGTMRAKEQNSKGRPNNKEATDVMTNLRAKARQISFKRTLHHPQVISICSVYEICCTKFSPVTGEW